VSVIRRVIFKEEVFYEQIWGLSRIQLENGQNGEGEAGGRFSSRPGAFS
jgi:hypothetical protein